MPAQPTFADRLKELREAAGLTQYALAKRSGLSKQAVSNLELGNREPSWETVQRLAAALDRDCQSFINSEIAIPGDEAIRPRGRPGKSADQAPTPGKRRPARKK